MNDMSQVIIPKSDQLNADDLIAGPRSYTIEGVEIRAGTEQPVSVFLRGEDRAWKPCKSMSRVLVAAWGPDANVYKGRSLTLYRDPKVKWGGMEIGGIRVSHMSHIDREMLLQLTATKGKRAPHIVKPLEVDQSSAPAGNDAAGKWANQYLAKLGKIGSLDELNAFANDKAAKLASLESVLPNAHRQCVAALDARRADITPRGGFDDDPFEGPAEAQRGESPATDTDARETIVTTIKQMIAAALGKESWQAAEAEWSKHEAALSDEQNAEIQRLLNARQAELQG